MTATLHEDGARRWAHRVVRGESDREHVRGLALAEPLAVEGRLRERFEHLVAEWALVDRRGQVGPGGRGHFLEKAAIGRLPLRARATVGRTALVERHYPAPELCE